GVGEWGNKCRPGPAAGKPFFARKDEQSGRVVAFAVTDDYLVLGTREDLVAAALELMSGSKGRNLRHEAWYEQSLAAASPAAGDLRMVMNMEKIAVTPHFRSYWIQHNITEMQSYSSAISDLYREAKAYREERVIIPRKQGDEIAIARAAQAVSALLPSVPGDAGFYQAGVVDVQQALAMLQQKILVPHSGVPDTPRLAPQVQLTGGATGAPLDLESRIDMEPASTVSGAKPAEHLRQELERAGPQAA